MEKFLSDSPELEHLELLAEVDSLVAQLKRWAESAPDWPLARGCQALVGRLVERTQSLRVRLQAPLVVATLGGTGTGKSTLVNALVGEEVTQSGRQRPTTRKPTFISRPEITPETLGISPEAVHVVHRDFPTLRELVIIDCPDPDTSEEASSGSNLDRLRVLVPHCDVLLVTGTQQKYRSARVAQELAQAAPGARMIFVQTHADTDDDIREDWLSTLSQDYNVSEIYFVDSLAALRDSLQGVQPRGDFGRLVDLLTRQLALCGATRIRRANFIDLVASSLPHCQQRIAGGMPAIEQLEKSVNEQRGRLAQKLAHRVRDELVASRRPWENRLLGEIASRWGMSPFALVLRAYQGLGRIASGAILMRVRTPAQLALWGALETGRVWQRKRQEDQVDNLSDRALAWGWDEADLRTAAIILDGYCDEANLPRDDTPSHRLTEQATRACDKFVDTASQQLQTLLSRLAEGHTGLVTRMKYELLMMLALGYLIARWGWNFFYESWWLSKPLYGLDFFVSSLFLILGWSGLLLWMFSLRLRSGIGEEIESLVQAWSGPQTCTEIFASIERRCREIRTWHEQLIRMENHVSQLRERLTQPEPRLGSRIR